MQSAVSSLTAGSRHGSDSALIINLFGGPGIGKTTLAARLFAGLKQHDVEAACPEEYAKIALWQGRDHLLDNQLILLGRTWDTVSSLSGKVDVIILDSPILLCSHYAGAGEGPHFHQTVLDFHKRHDRVNILLSRDPEMSYSMSGRRETSSQARDIDTRIEALLNEAGESYSLMNQNETRFEELLRDILALISSRK